MFWKVKKLQEKLFNVNPNTDWIILRINPEILWQKKAYFCCNNAASYHERFNPDKMSVTAFKAMFADLEYVNRNDLNIPKNYTTNPQAEVVFIETIEPHWIIDICIKDGFSGFSMNCYLPDHLDEPYKYEDDILFNARSDYKYW